MGEKLRLPIPEPDMQLCSIYSFSGTTLEIRAHRVGSAIDHVIQFIGVEYYSGQRAWKGALLDIEDSDTTRRFLIDLGLVPNASGPSAPAPADVTRLRLYSTLPVESRDIRTLIVAAEVNTYRLQEL